MEPKDIEWKTISHIAAFMVASSTVFGRTAVEYPVAMLSNLPIGVQRRTDDKKQTIHFAFERVSGENGG
jgi:hypothetical protein